MRVLVPVHSLSRNEAWSFKWGDRTASGIVFEGGREDATLRE